LIKLIIYSLINSDKLQSSPWIRHKQ